LIREHTHKHPRSTIAEVRQAPRSSNNAIDDYSSGLGGSYSDTSTRYRTGNYAVDIVLDEAYHEYRTDEVP